MFGLGALVLLLLSGCGSDGGGSKIANASDPLIRPEAVARGSEVQLAPDLETMVASSNVVLVGRIEAVRQGRTVGDPGSQLRFREVDVRPLEVLHGDVPTRSTLLVEQEGWWLDGESEVSFANEGQGWLQVGTTTLLFLVDKGGEEAGHYRAISSQGAYLLAGTDVRPVPSAAPSEDPLVATLADVDLDQVEADISDASHAAANGSATPVTTPPIAS